SNRARIALRLASSIAATLFACFPGRTAGETGRMADRAAITVNRPRDEVERLWSSPGYRPEYVDEADAAVSFRRAPGDRGTEIHVDLDRATPGGRLGEAVLKLLGSEPLAKVKDDLRRFKQRVETGEVARSEGTPEGELAARKLKQRPAQPLEV
ncbi:MAG TPA: hypothetical protein VNB64_06275, partial [Solirubrobacteraceae bacterium]|nr:hypothetical protein [Solirubrobacteraceae bacterium]